MRRVVSFSHRNVPSRSTSNPTLRSIDLRNSPSCSSPQRHRADCPARPRHATQRTRVSHTGSGCSRTGTPDLRASADWCCSSPSYRRPRCTPRPPMSPEVAIRVVELLRNPQPIAQSPAGLSPQETRLLKLLTEGHQNKTAAELGISVHTVSFHLRSIYEKLHGHSRSEAVARALREGLFR